LYRGASGRTHQIWWSVRAGLQALGGPCPPPQPGNLGRLPAVSGLGSVPRAARRAALRPAAADSAAAAAAAAQAAQGRSPGQSASAEGRDRRGPRRAPLLPAAVAVVGRHG